MTNEIDYNDERLTAIEKSEEAALQETEASYGEKIQKSDDFYQTQIDAVEAQKQEQTRLQQARTDFTIGQIQQQKEQTEKDYIKEQAGAYADWKKQSDPHGVNAEAVAAAGLTGSGYSESSRVAMYTAYQNRVAIAKQSFTEAVTAYDNAMTEARLQNDAALAEIAYNTLQQSLALTLQSFQDHNELLAAKEQALLRVEATYNGYYQDMVDKLKNSPVNTPYYLGELNSDAKTYGTFSNGYQPKGISGHGKLTKSGETVTFDTEVQYGAEAGQTKTVTQNVWVAEDGTKWYWEGRLNRYVQYNAQFNGKTSEPFSPLGVKNQIANNITNSYGSKPTIYDTKHGGSYPQTVSTGSTNIEQQLIKLGYAGISPEYLMSLIESGEIIMTENSDGTYTLEKGKKKTTNNAGIALNPDGVVL